MQKPCIMLSVLINKKKIPCEMLYLKQDKSLFQYHTRTNLNVFFFFLDITLCLLVKLVDYAMNSPEQCILDWEFFVWIFGVLLEDFVWRQHRLQAEKCLETTVLNTKNISYPKPTNQSAGNSSRLS